jgi:hypothetical protein
LYHLEVKFILLRSEKNVVFASFLLLAKPKISSARNEQKDAKN